jgi:hypothetical protein
MGVKLTSAETTVNKSAAAAASGTKNKILIAPWTSTYAKLPTLGSSNVATTLTDTSSTVPISITSVAISSVTITDSNWNPLDDTAVSTAGGYFKLTGIGFQSGCVVYAQGTAASSVQFVSATELRIQTPTLTAGTLHLYVVNPDGSVAITLTGFKVSGVPNWITTSPLTTQLQDTAFTIPLSANSDSTITYSVASGSSLPSGVSLTANGVLSGTVTGLSVDTTYSFNLVATDLENQDTTKTFSVSVTLGDPYFYLTTLLLNAESNTWITDASTNKFVPTIGNDTRPVGFSPYNAYWSQLFAAGNYLQVSGNNNLAFGTSDFTIECFFYSTDVSTSFFIYDSRTTISQAVPCILGGGGTVQYYVSGATRITSGTIVNNRWYHLVLSRVSGSTRMFLDGVQTGSTYTDSTTYINPTNRPLIGTNGDGASFAFYGYISNLRVLNGTGTTSPTVPTSPLTVVTNTQLLTLQSNLLKDNGNNAFAITTAGSPSAKSFSPFTETDLISGSAYFDGTGDYLSYADSSALELGSNNFCFECWIYPTTLSGTAVIIDKRVSSYAPLMIWRSAGNMQAFMSSTGTSWDIVNSGNFGPNSGALTVNMWHHIAVYRVGTTVYGAINGNVTTIVASTSATLHNNSGNWFIGMNTDGSTNPYTGYISDVRMVIGSSVYTSANFTPPAVSLTAVTNTQLLSLQYRKGENNHRFVDESTTRALTTRSGNLSQGSFSPFSPVGWSAYFDGTGDYLSIGTAADWVSLHNSSAKWTIELLVYPITYNGTLIETCDSSSQVGIVLGLSASDGYVQLNVLRGVTSSFVIDVTGSVTVPRNSWSHVQVSYDQSLASNNVVIYVNGVLNTATAGSLSKTANAPSSSNPTSPLYVGYSTATQFQGYVSNLRILNGTARTNVAVPISALTAIANTVLLTCQDNRFRDNSTANNGSGFLVTRNGDAKIQSFSPFRNSGVYTPATHGGSAYFDGSSDYLYITKSDTVTLGTNDHCIEFWMYPDGTQARYSELWSYSIGASTGATNTYYGSIGNDSGGNIVVLGGPLSGSWAVTLGMAAPSTEYNAALNGWTHVVLTRKGSAYRLFLNGVLKAYTTYSGSIIAQGSSFSIGWDGSDPFTYYKGWMSNFRVINGSIPTAYQTSNTTLNTAIFTPPTSVPAYEANTVLQMDFTNGAIVDVTARNVIETVADAKVSNTQSKFGIGSMYFDGTGDYLYVPGSTVLYQGSRGDITLETWVYINSLSTTQTIFYINGGTSGYASIRLDMNATTGYLALLVSTDGANWAINGTSSTGLTVGTWKHIAVVRSGGTFTLYIDGVSVVTSTAVAATTTLMNGAQNQIGANYQTGFTNNLNGYLDDVRISRIARYTGNFTPNTTPFFVR